MTGPGSDHRTENSDRQPSKQTCDTCRARKVKCDGRLDCCGNCERLQYVCSFRGSRASHDESASSSITYTSYSAGNRAFPARCAAGARDRRVSQACRRCHAAKARCTGALPACARCTSRGLDCVYPQSTAERPERRQNRQHQQHQSPGDLATTPRIILPGDHAPEAPYHQYPLLTRTRVLGAMRAFFERLHPFSGLAFLHKPSILHLYSSGEADPALIASIVAVASRLPGTTSDEATIGFQCASITHDIVRDTLGQPSVFRLQALVLLLRFRLWTGSTNDALLMMPYLARSAFLLGLNHESTRPASSFVYESHRRLMWAIYMLDIALADGLQQYTACPITEIHLRLPCTEDDFELSIKTHSESIQQGATSSASSRLGIIGYHIRIAHLGDEILRYGKRLVRLRADPDAVHAEFLSLERQLEAFQLHLPEHERYSQKNLTLRVFFPRLSRWVMTHILWHTCHCQLFRSVVPTIPATFSQRLADRMGESSVVNYQKKCLEHAVSVATIFSQLRDMAGDTCILDMDMADSAFKATEILLLSSESVKSLLGVAQSDLLRHASVCSQLADSLVGMYPAVAPIAADLTKALHSFAQGAPLSLAIPVEQTSPQQLVTKHSALYASAFADDLDRLEMRDTTSQASSTSPHAAVPLVNEDGQVPVGNNAGFAEDGAPGQTEFAWPGLIPDHWDQSPLFQGAFDTTVEPADWPHISPGIQDLGGGPSVGSVA